MPAPRGWVVVTRCSLPRLSPSRRAAGNPIPTSHHFLRLRTRYAGCEVASVGAQWGLGWLRSPVRLAPPGHRRSPVARARRTFRAAGPRTVVGRACAAYVSRRRAADQRRSGDFWLCRVGSLIEKEARHLFTAETGARTPSREDRRRRGGRRGRACTRLYRRPPRSRIDFAPFPATAHQVDLMRSRTSWCEVEIGDWRSGTARAQP